MTIKQKLLSVALLLFLLLFCLFILAGTGEAAAYQITETELTRLEQNSIAQEASLMRALALLNEQESESTALRTELQAALDELTQSKKEIQVLKEKLTTALNSITKANQSLEEYEQEVKAEFSRLKRQRDISQGIGMALVLLAAFK